MIPNEAFQKLLYELFCTWHGVRRHYDPPITDSEEQRIPKVKSIICKLLSEIDARVARVRNEFTANDEEFCDEWNMLTWNVLCITSRLQNLLANCVASSEDKVIFSRLNIALVELVNSARESITPTVINANDPFYISFQSSLSTAMHSLHGLYQALNGVTVLSPTDIQEFRICLQRFADEQLIPCIENFKSFCNIHCIKLWKDVRAAQIQRMCDLQPLPAEPIKHLVSFYSHMMYTLGILGARLQGFRYELMSKKLFGSFDPVQRLSEAVFSALELLMSDCVLATEPSTSAILVTNNLFSMECGALARGVVFKDFEVQVVSEEIAEQIQSDMRRQKMLQQPSPIADVPSAALLAMKPTSGTKRGSGNQSCFEVPLEHGASTSHKKTDVNSKESVLIYPVYHAKNRYWAAEYPHLLCTTRQKGRHSTNSSYQDLSLTVSDGKSSGKRPIFYFHIRATMFSPSGKFATAHTLSLPFTISTRRNQDCQVQRMMSSYTATCFWLYGSKVQDGLLLNWVDTGLQWQDFKELFKQHFKVNADVKRDLLDSDFDLLHYKLQCHDCQSGEPGTFVNGLQQIVTFKNVLCPHLRYECGNTNVRFSVWRGMLELLQIFQDSRTQARKFWEKNLLMGFLEFDQVAEILENFESALVIRLSFVTGGTLCITVKSSAHALGQTPTAPIHLEPLDLKKLQAKNLKDYLRDIADAERVNYIVNANLKLVCVRDVLGEFNEASANEEEELTSRDISSNVTHSGDIDAMQHIRFTAMRIAVVTCKVNPPSCDDADPDHGRIVKKANHVGFLGRLPATVAPNDDFLRELAQLMNFHMKSKQDVIEALERIPNDYLCARNANSATMQYSPSVCSAYSQNTSAVPTPATSPNLLQAPSYDQLMVLDCDQSLQNKYNNFLL
uniref:Protein kinase domain-containing protein n=1 Tax=Syphacia muris TaxID=451379 RepID=A0A158R4L6_9BILA